MHSYKIVHIIIALMLFTGCKKFIEIEPPRNELIGTTVFSSDASARSAIRGIYSLMITNVSFTRGAMEEYCGIASDELINYSSRAPQIQFYENALTKENGDLQQIFWSEPYKYINNANGIIEGLENSVGISEDVKSQIEGEARFIRSFCHFYLAVLFGDIPYVSSTDYKVNSKLARMSFQEVLIKIEEDLVTARSLLDDNYLHSNGERVQANKMAASALLARLYLYLQNWQKAEEMATEVINNSNYELLTDLNSVFLANSREAIWQLMPIVPGQNTPQGQVFILTNAPNTFSRRVSMTPELVSAFESNDLRMVDWVQNFSNTNGSWYYVHKYKIRLSPTVTEYSMILRFAEQFLIRAEARAQLQNLQGSQADLNIIRNRAGLPNTSASDKASLLNAIEQERRVEMFGEFGNRWLDLKRYNRADAVLSSLKSGWDATDTLFPIPQSEILLNPNLTQNPGY